MEYDYLAGDTQFDIILDRIMVTKYQHWGIK
jgi:hypothetical protein